MESLSLLGVVVLQEYCTIKQCRVGVFHAKRRVCNHPPFLIQHYRSKLSMTDSNSRNTPIRCCL